MGLTWNDPWKELPFYDPSYYSEPKPLGLDKLTETSDGKDPRIKIKNKKTVVISWVTVHFVIIV